MPEKDVTLFTTRELVEEMIARGWVWHPLPSGERALLPAPDQTDTHTIN